MKDLGTVNPGKTIYIEFDSFGADGQSLTLTGLAVTDVEVYRDGSVTQRSSDAGYTLLDTDGIDFDGITGIHGLSINLADNTDAGFWRAGSHYRVVIASVTINAQTVSFTAATFRIGYQGAVLDTTIATLASQTSFTLTDGPAEDDALNGCIVLIHDVASAVQKGFAVVQDYTGSTKTVTLTAGTTFTVAATDNISFFPPVNAAYGGAVAYTATRGLSGTALPNAAADAAGGLPISDAGGLDLDNRMPAAAAITNLNTVFNTDFATNYDATNDRWTVNVKTWNDLTTVALPLVPTVAGRTLDVSAGGEAGVDWANIGSPTTVVGLSGTTVKTATDVETDTADIQSRLPAALVSGRMDSNMQAAAAGVITATVIADGAIDRATFAADTGLQSVRSNTAQAGGATSITLDASASATTDLYAGQRVYLTGGTGAGQDRLITAYNGTTKVATVDHAWATNPDVTSTFAIAPNGRADIEAISLDSGAADNAETAFDGGSYSVGGGGIVAASVTGAVGSISGVTFPSNFAALGINASGHVSRVVLVDTLTTYTGNTVQTGDAYAALTTAVPDSVPADGSRPTIQQGIYMLVQAMIEGSISSTTWTVKKPDGTTTLFTVTLDSATTPTSKTRAT